MVSKELDHNIELKNQQLPTLANIRIQAIRYLSYREHAVDELGAKLLKKFNSKVEVDQVLGQLISENLLSEVRYAESYLRARMQKGFGPERIRSELLRNGVDRAVVEESLKCDEVNWCDEIRKVWLKKFGGEKSSKMQDKKRQWQFLQYRGFSQEQIKVYFDQYSSGFPFSDSLLVS